MLGSTFRTGYGVYALDKLMIDLGSGASGGEITKKLGAEFVANIVNTYTIPAAVVKDLYSQFDSESRKIPETRTGEIDFWDIVKTRGFRAAPDFGPDNIIGEYFGAEEYDVASRSPFREGDLKSINPLEKQLFGFNKGPKKNVVEKEMAELNFAYYDLYKKHPNELIDRLIREELSDEDGELNLVKYMTIAMNNPKYKNLNRSERKPRFEKLIQAKITEARVAAKAKLEKDESRLGFLVTTVDISKWNEVSSDKKNAVASAYRRLFPLKQGEDTDMYDGKNIRVDADRMITLPDGREVPVMLWALDASTKVDDI
tara:strand:+ start:1 stop:942 length:942 start_codon:yes stop_codon:yes gene_type:complete